MLFTLIPGCSNLSKMTQDTLPPFPKAAHLTVLLRNLLLTFYSTKAENLGQEKKNVYCLPTVLLYENWTIAYLSVLRSPGFITLSACIIFSL